MSEQAKQEKREIPGAFAHIEVSVVHLWITLGQPVEELEFSAEAAVLPQLASVVEGDTLRIGPAEGASFSTNVPIKVTLSAPQLSSISASAGARVHVSGLVQEQFQARSASGAQVTLQGQTSKLSAWAESGGTIDRREIRCSSISSQASSGGRIL